MAQKVQIVPHNFWHGFTSLAAAIWFLLMHKASCISLPVAPIITSLILCLLEHGEISYSCKLQPTISAVFCWFSDAFWYVHLEYLEPVVYTWWALVLWAPYMPWKACLLFWHWVLPWLHKTPPLAMLWPSCAACSLLNCWCTNQDAMMQAAASNDPSMFITALLFTEKYWCNRNIIIRNYYEM